MTKVAWKIFFGRRVRGRSGLGGAGDRARRERGAPIQTRSAPRSSPSPPVPPAARRRAATFGDRDKRHRAEEPRGSKEKAEWKRKEEGKSDRRGHLCTGRKGRCRAFQHRQDGGKPSRTGGRVPTLVRWLHGKVRSLRAGWLSSWKDLPEILLKKVGLKPVWVSCTFAASPLCEVMHSVRNMPVKDTGF